MKLAIIGKGKTGSKVVELWGDRPHTVFDSANPPTSENLQNHDVAVVFVNAVVFERMIPTLLEANIPVVSGVTGYEWPEELNERILEKEITWVKANNFALGMNLVHTMIKVLEKTPVLFDEYQFDLHEVHHTKKVDAPSGTAKSWGNWLGCPVNITSERTGDVVGDHQLTLTTAHEKITLRHEALDRKIFAEGALWAAQKIYEDAGLKHGLLQFEDIAKDLLKGLKERI